MKGHLCIHCPPCEHPKEQIFSLETCLCFYCFIMFCDFKKNIFLADNVLKPQCIILNGNLKFESASKKQTQPNYAKLIFRSHVYLTSRRHISYNSCLESCKRAFGMSKKLKNISPCANTSPSR